MLYEMFQDIGFPVLEKKIFEGFLFGFDWSCGFREVV